MRSVIRRVHFGKLVLATLASVPWIPPCEAISLGISQPLRAIPPSFEEAASADRSPQYVWHNSSVVVTLASGGMVTLRQQDGISIRMSFPRANARSEPLGESRSQRKTLYYIGPEQSWREHAHVEQVRYPAIYPGIDLVFTTNLDQLEYNFEIAPYADPKLIRIHFDPARLRINHHGDVAIDSPGGTILQHRARAFQRAVGTERLIECRYHLVGHRSVTLDIGPYDHSAPLFIDPILAFSTYIGGSGYDAIYAMATDASGNLYLAGETSSLSLWNDSSPSLSSRRVFITKLNSSASQILFTVYLGGSASDSAKAIAVDPSGNVYVTGVAGSTDFPTTSGAYSNVPPTPPEAFVAKLNATGQLIYSTYLGNAGQDFGFAITADSNGAAYIAGQTQSVSFPVTAGAFQTTYQGGVSDCFVSKLNASGTALIYSTFLGGSGLDLCTGIAVDSSSNAYVTGTTGSPDFPTLQPLQSLQGTTNAFITKINATGSALLYSTLLGGCAADQANAIALDQAGNAYIVGATASADFPVTPGAAQTILKGMYNAFVSKLSANGSSLIYSTLIGGSSSDAATSIAVDPAGRAFLGGYTTSSNFPAVSAVQSAIHGSFDAFASVLDPNGAALLFSSYFGGSGDDRAYGIALSPNGGLYLSGLTFSANFPSAAAIQPALKAPYDAFLLGVNGIEPGLAISSSHVGDFAQGQANASYTLRISNPGNAPTSGMVTVTEAVPSGLALISMSGAGWTCLANTCSRSDVLAAGASYPAIVVLTNVNLGATSPQVNSVSVSGGGFGTVTATDSTTVGVAGGPTSFLASYALDNPPLRNNFTGWVGMKLMVGPNPLTVLSLGRICVVGNSGIHTIEFLNASTGVVVPGGSAQVNMSGCTPGQFAYRALSSSITLQDNTPYYLASQEFAGGDQWYDTGQVASNKVAAVTNSVYSANGSTWVLATTVANTSYAPPNFMFSPPSGTINITVQANPTGASYLVDGVTNSTSSVLQWISGSSHTLAAVSPQSAGTGAQYVWTNWSDGGAASHTVTPTSNTTFTANFNTQYLLTQAVLPLAAGTITADPGSSTGYYNGGTSVQLTAEANPGFTFLNWGGVLSGSTARQSLSLSAPASVTANFQPDSSDGASSFLTGYALNNLVLRNNFTGWVGMKVVVGPNPLTVPSLGRICLAGNSGVHTVQVVNAGSGIPVPGGSVPVNMSGCTPGQFVYTTLSSPITLQAGSGYYLASQEFAGGDYWYELGPVTPDTGAAVTNPIYSFDGAMWMIATNVADTSYVPPNFTYWPASNTASFLTSYGLDSPILRNNFTGWVGMKLVVGPHPLTVPSLGRICVAGNSGTHTVEFVDAGTGIPVTGGSVQVNMAGCTPGQFVYTTLSSSITLQPGAAYYLASQEFVGGDRWYTFGRVSSTTDAAVSNPIYSFDGSLWTLATNVANTSYVPPNFTYWPPSSTASSFVTSYGVGSPILRNDFAGWVGMKLTVGSYPLTVRSLGRICVAGNSGTHTVEFVNAGSGIPVANGSVQVNMSGCTPGQFVFSPLSSSLTLQAGAAYYLASQEFVGGDRWYTLGQVSSTTDAAVNSPIYSFDGSIWTPTTNVANTSYVPPNFTYLPLMNSTTTFETSFVTGYALDKPVLRNDFTGWVGMRVVVGPNPLTISSIGRICIAGNSGTHTVELVNSGTGVAMAGGSVLVHMSGCTPGQFVYAALSSTITLPAKTAFYVASQEFAGGDRWYALGQVSSTTDAAVTNPIYSFDGAKWTLATNVANTSHVPPNFIYLSPW